MADTSSNPKDPAVKPERIWKDLLPGQARKAISEGVHFSGKTINSNAKEVGVRLPTEFDLLGSGVGFSTTRLDRRIVDYASGGAKTRVFSQAISVITGGIDEHYVGCSAEQHQMAEAEVASMPVGAFEIGTDVIDARLRQMLFEHPEGETIAVTPLHSSVFSKELSSRLAVERAIPDVHHRLRAHIAIGGSKPQNVGRYAYLMRDVLAFSAPTESRGARVAYAIFHRGPSLSRLMPRADLLRLKAWRAAQAGRTSRRAARAYEARSVARVASGFIREADRLADLARPYSAKLGGMTAAHVDTIGRGLMDASLRTSEWRAQLSTVLIGLIEDFRARSGDAPLAPSGSLRHLQGVVEAAL